MELARWPFFSIKEVKKVTEILNSGKVNSWAGLETHKFEKEFANYIGVNYGVGMSNGTVALSAAYIALGIKKDDEVITTPRTFIATSSTLLMIGAKPIFADVDINSGNINCKTIRPLINKATKAIAVVHLGGWPAEMESICALGKEFGLRIIEDCSQAHGASINGKKVGSFGDIATWSFCQDKIISTGGEGGMVTTNDFNLYKKLWSLKDHGKSLDLIKNNKNDHTFKWLHEGIGSNCRLTEVQSGIGRIQLKRLNKTNLTRQRNAEILLNKLKTNKLLRIPLPPKKYKHAWYKFYVYLNSDKLKPKWNRDKILNELNKAGVKSYAGSCSEIYLEKCFKIKDLIPKKRLPNAKLLGESSLMFLVHQTISTKQMKKYALEINRILLEAII